ncbi:hypothetical protein [Flavobacterium sp.]|jgi:hypothetical protein|uniref:hypothetical protein n=1 Tax=Flavobacterium sp. TaxID=239 RepID=UPI0037C08892
MAELKTITDPYELLDHFGGELGASYEEDKKTAEIAMDITFSLGTWMDADQMLNQP